VILDGRDLALKILIELGNLILVLFLIESRVGQDGRDVLGMFGGELDGQDISLLGVDNGIELGLLGNDASDIHGIIRLGAIEDLVAESATAE